MKDLYGVVSGRFQPLHIGHMEYILEGLNFCDHLIVGVTNPDPSLTSKHQSNPERSMPNANPYTYWERKLMIERSLTERGVSLGNFSVVPCPISYPELIKYYLPKDPLVLITKYDEWGEHKHNLFSGLGYRVLVMWKRNLSDKVTTGTYIRNSIIAKDNNWKKFVPNAVHQIINELSLQKNI